MPLGIFEKKSQSFPYLKCQGEVRDTYPSSISYFENDTIRWVQCSLRAFWSHGCTHKKHHQAKSQYIVCNRERANNNQKAYRCVGTRTMRYCSGFFGRLSSSTLRKMFIHCFDAISNQTQEKKTEENLKSSLHVHTIAWLTSHEKRSSYLLSLSLSLQLSSRHHHRCQQYQLAGNVLKI